MRFYAVIAWLGLKMVVSQGLRVGYRIVKTYSSIYV